MANIALNKYATESDYENDSTRPTDISTVSLVTGTNNIHYDGVNVKRFKGVVPSVGDAVYVPTACVYTGATPGAGVESGESVIIAGETLDHAKMSAAGYTAVGVVSNVRGRSAVVLWKTGSGAIKFAADATDASFTIPSGVLSDDDYVKIYVPTMRDKAGRVGFRQTGSTSVLSKLLMGQGGSGGSESWNGGTGSNGGDIFFTAKEWGWTNDGPDAGKTVPAEVYQEYENDPNTPTEEGWLRYLESRKNDMPSDYEYDSVVWGKSKAATKVLTDVNDAQDRAYFPIVQFAKAHNDTWGSYGEFYNVPGLKHGDWFMMSLDYALDLFKNIRYSLSGYNRNSDPVNRTLNAISGQAIELNRASNDCRYWLPLLSARGTAWTMMDGGFYQNTNGLNNTRRSLSAAILEF